MIASILHKGESIKVDLSKPIDISLSLRAGENNVAAWHVGPVKIEPVRMGDWVGDVKQGGQVNFRDIFFNPHGHGTHTECVGHISKEDFFINQCLKTFFFLCQVVSITPEEKDGDRFISKEQVLSLQSGKVNAFAIRTLPNSKDKLVKKYTNSNPVYIRHEAITYLVQNGIEHFLIDTPSVDKEEDGGKLLAHHAFWEYPHNTQTQRTITELIYIPDSVPDGIYLLNLQIASFENDASPSKPVLYRLL